MKRFCLLSFLLCSLLLPSAIGFADQTSSEDPFAEETSEVIKPNPVKPVKVDRSLGLGYFRKNGYKDFVEPRVSFVKRKERTSEVIEYSWRPMQIHDMPHKERIDLVRFSYNRYFFSGPEKKMFFGGGVGGNIILFNDKLKDWASDRGISLKDGLNGLGRLFLGFKIREFPFNKTVYPIVFRVDAMISPPYKFGGELGHAGDRLKLTEITAGISFSIE